MKERKRSRIQEEGEAIDRYNTQEDIKRSQEYWAIMFKKAEARETYEYKLWRKAVFERDNYTCQMCGQKGKELNVHHLRSFKNFPELRLAMNNGITLCKICHRKVKKI